MTCEDCEVREILKPLLEGKYYHINIALIPETKEISQIKVTLFRNIGNTIVELIPMDYENWIVHKIMNENASWLKKKGRSEETFLASKYDLIKLFKNFIIQRSLYFTENTKPLQIKN